MDVDPKIAEIATEFLARNSGNIYEVGRQILNGTKNKIQIKLSNTYKSYITSAAERYGKAKSFFIRDTPTFLYEFYVPLGVTFGEEKIPQLTYSKVITRAQRAVVTGVAGSGKSMLMRHLFLSVLKDEEKIPIFVELRDINNKEKSLIDLIQNSLENHKFKLGLDYIKMALLKGHFAIFLDGYDEVAYSMRGNVTEQIFSLCQEAPDCSILISSRPDDIFNGWEEFASLRLNPLRLNEAIELVEKLPYDIEIKKKFVIDLRKNLFKSHESFLSNPLLLSIMLLTYGQSADIPRKLSIFYNQAYEALYQRHDALKGGFQRDRLSKLDIQDFSKVFSAFCLQTYDRRLFQFSRTDALSCIEKSKNSTNISVNSQDYLTDLLQSACLLVEDGLLLVFSHRSFQEYFVAKFIYEAAPSVQKKLIDRFSKNINNDDVMSLLYDLDQFLVERFFIIPNLKRLFQNIGVKNKVGISHFMKFMQSEYEAIVFFGGPRGTSQRSHLGLLVNSQRTFGEVLDFFVRKDEKFNARMVERNTPKKLEEEFISKYKEGGVKGEKIYSEIDKSYYIDKLNYRSPIIRDLSKLGGRLSVEYLQIAFDELKSVEARHKSVGADLDALLAE